MNLQTIVLLLSVLAVSSATYQPPRGSSVVPGFNGRRQPVQPQRSCPGTLPLSKLMLNQSDYVQYVHYFTPIPDITSFTMQYWFNLIDTQRTSTMFDYTYKENGQAKSTVIIQLQGGHPQRWILRINDVLVSSVASPLVKAGEWHHMVHSWDSKTGAWSVFMDGAILETSRSSLGYKLVVPGGGDAVSGQRQNTLGDGMDRKEGLAGWLTLLEMSSRPLLYPQSPATLTMISNLASRCEGTFHGEIISWTRTQRKGYGGVAETPSQKVCGHF